jgi:hypothetical protein
MGGMHRTPALAISVLLLAVPVAVGAADECTAPSPDEPSAALSRTDLDVSGNRVAAGCGPLTEAVLEVELGGTPAWVVADPTDRGRSWFVVLEDGTVDLVIEDGSDEAFVSQSESPPLPAGHPPLAVSTGEDEVVVGSALGATGWFADPLPDARVTEIAGAALVAPVGPTDRYAHGVLGDALEAAAVEVRDQAGPLARIAVDPDEVIEGTSAMVVELADNGLGPELLVTVSDPDEGARLRAYALDGSIVAESMPIGQGNRWLHQIGVGPLAPDGELEIIAVRTPHIGGIVQAYRLVDDRFELAGTAEGYSSHQLGSANLDMALLADTDGDGRLDVVVPTQAMDELALLARSEDGFTELGRLALEGRLATNVAATPDPDGRLVIAAGTDDGRLRIFR